MSDTPIPTDVETETQRRTAALVRSISVPAPASLHRSIRELTDRAPRPRRTWSGRPALLAGALAGAAVLAIALVLALGGSGQSAPTVLQASVLALRPATLGAPGESPGAPGRLAISAEGIAYPYWGQRFGWQAVGARTDRLGGRTVTTVFYASASAGPSSAQRTGSSAQQTGSSAQQSAPPAQRTAPAGQRIGYSIVAGAPLALPTAGHAAVWRGTRFEVLHSGPSTVVTWRRAGHTCILVGSKVSSRTLLTLANWQAT